MLRPSTPLRVKRWAAWEGPLFLHESDGPASRDRAAAQTTSNSALEDGVNCPGYAMRGLSDFERMIDGLLPALRWLDQLLERAVSVAQVVYGPNAAADSFRGLHIDRDQLDQLLARAPCEPAFRMVAQAVASRRDPTRDSPQLGWLKRVFDLSSFDVWVILIALAPEIDLRYERLYAYLQDDVTRKRPTVDLALSLLCSTADEKLTKRAHFGQGAPLIRHALVHLIADPAQLHPPLLAHYVKVDDQIVRQLLGPKGLDPRLTAFCELVEPTIRLYEVPLDTATRQGLTVLARWAKEADKPLKLYFHGLRDSGKRLTAEAFARELDAPLMVADLSSLVASDRDFEQALRLVSRERQFRGAVLYLTGFAVLSGDEHNLQREHLFAVLDEDTGVSVLAGENRWFAPRAAESTTSAAMVVVPFPSPNFAQRRACWATDLPDAADRIAASDLDALASRFRLRSGQIARAVVSARSGALWRVATDTNGRQPTKKCASPVIGDLLAAARAQSGHELATLARKTEPRVSWNDLVLPPDQLDQLREICDQAKLHHVVYDKWGFNGKLSRGRGLSVLFSGSPGTGKTMAAELIAGELGLDIYTIDLSRVVSKYIGETEKNLEAAFTAAETANAILFFDEADTLFGKRSAIQDAHDRYANIEVGYLLQKMEEYEGVAILATNMRTNMDDAFIRRLKFSVEFAFPDEAYRCKIWETRFPATAPRSGDIDFGFLARQFKLAGGNINNVVINASFLGAADDGLICMRHIIKSVKREFQKMGKSCSQAEFMEYYALIRD